MADIHLGKLRKLDSGKGRLQVVYHIPLDSPKAGAAPTPTSSIDAILGQAERDALAGGTLVEVNRQITVTAGDAKADILAALKVDWQNMRQRYNDQFNFEHKFLGQTIDVTA